MAIMPVPTCCELHAHNYTCIPIFLGRRGTPDPTGQLVSFYFWRYLVGAHAPFNLKISLIPNIAAKMLMTHLYTLTKQL